MQELLLAVARGLVEDKEAVKVTVDEPREDVERELVCDQIIHRKSDCFCSLKEIKCSCIISQSVYP